MQQQRDPLRRVLGGLSGAWFGDPIREPGLFQACRTVAEIRGVFREQVEAEVAAMTALVEEPIMSATASDITWIANFIWGIADDVLRDLYVRGKYRDVILPMLVLRRLDSVLEPTKADVLAMKEKLDAKGIVNQEAALKATAKNPFYNSSKFSLRDLRSRANPAAAQGRLRGLPGRLLQ